MAKSKARPVTASEHVQGLVDRGFEIDVEAKNLGFEDKGIKKMLTDELAKEFEEGSAIRVAGEVGAAVVSQTEKFVIKGEAAAVDSVRVAAEKGFLGDAVKTEQTLNVPVADRQRAASILQEAGIEATTSVQVSVDPAEYRILRDSESASVEAIEAKKTLEGVIERSVSFRVKYEKA